jgi:hypothetical protein
MEGREFRYIELASSFLNGSIGTESFIQCFIDEFKADDHIYPESRFEVLDSLFSACDLYAEGEKDEWNVGMDELKRAAEVVVRSLTTK